MATRIIGQLELLTSDAECRTWFERFELLAQANQLFRAVPAIPELANDNSNAAAVETAKTNAQNATQGNTAVFLSYLAKKALSRQPRNAIGKPAGVIYCKP